MAWYNDNDYNNSNNTIAVAARGLAYDETASWHTRVKVKVKVKESRNRPGVAQSVPGGLGSQISMTFGTWRYWGRRPHAPAAFTPRKYSWYSFSLGGESTPGPWHSRKEICHWKIQWQPGIDPGTVRLVAQRLNHYATPGDRPTTSAAP
jgi:hypothetical protein